MKRKLIVFLFALCTTMGAWAAVPDDYFSTDYEHAIWLSLSNANNNSYVMFANGTTMTTRAKASTNYAAWQQVAFVGTKSSFKIYSYCNGSTKALYAANSNNGTPVSWVDPASASTWVLEETYANVETKPGYGICLSGNTSMSLNMYAGAGNDCKFYGLSDAGSRWNIAIASGLCVEDGKVYKISSYQNTPALYQIINSATASEVINRGDVIATNQGYWLCHTNGDTYTFESAMGDGKYLAWKGLSTTSEAYNLYFATNANVAQCVSLYRNGGDGSKYLYVHKSSGGGTNSWNQNSVGAFADGGSTDYKFEEVTGVSVYRVVSNINAGGVAYSPSYTGTAEQTNGGFYVFSSNPSANDFTPIAVTNCTPGDITVDTTEKTITVNYNLTYSYTFTDVSGQEHTGSLTGEFGVTPTLTGCDGYELSNEAWDKEACTYTADITFPFPVSSSEVTNWTYIGQFHNKGAINGRTSKDFLWHAESTGVIVHNYDAPTNESVIHEKYKWAIYPSISDGAITFKIKNSSSGYISTTYTGEDSGGHAVGNVTHTAEASAATPVIYYNYTGSNYAFKTTTTNKHLSVNSVNGGENQVLGVYSDTHDGISVAFYTPADFTTLMANLKAARNLFNSYFLPWSQGKYSETVEGTMTTVYAQMDTDRNVVADTPTAYFTATQFKTYTDNYNNAIPGLRYVVPTFFRVKNLAGTKYIKEHATVDYNNFNQLLFSADGTDASSIFYLNASNNIISYYSGLYLFAINHTAGLNYGGYNLSNYKCTYEFLPGTAVNQVYVHAVTDPVGWGGDNKYWSATDTNIDRVATPTANSDFLIEEVTSLPVSIISIDGHGFASFYTPVDISSLPEGVKAYIATISGSRVQFTEVTDIPAGNGVILYMPTCAENTTVNLTIGTASSNVEGNILTGVEAKTVLGGQNVMTMQNGSNGLGFYKYNGTYLNGFKAYINITGEISGIKSFVFDFEDDETGISPLLTSPEEEGQIYNLAGQRISKMQKGINIVNGKKVLF